MSAPTAGLFPKHWLYYGLFALCLVAGGVAATVRLAEERAAVLRLARIDLEMVNLEVRSPLLAHARNVKLNFDRLLVSSRLTAEDFRAPESGRTSALSSRLAEMDRVFRENNRGDGLILNGVTLVDAQARVLLGSLPGDLRPETLVAVMRAGAATGGARTRLLHPYFDATWDFWVRGVVVTFPGPTGEPLGALIYRVRVAPNTWGRQVQFLRREDTRVMVLHEEGDTFVVGRAEYGRAARELPPVIGATYLPGELRRALESGEANGVLTLPASEHSPELICRYSQDLRATHGVVSLVMTDADAVLASWRRSCRITVIAALAFVCLSTLLLIQDSRRRALRAGLRRIQDEVRERRRLELEMLRHNVELEERVAERTRSLAEATAALDARTRELAEANRELDAYAGTVSHDLRAPLRRITAFAEIILEDRAENLDAVTRRELASVIATSGAMTGLVENLLNLSRFLRVKCRRESVDLSAMVGELLAALAAASPGRTVRFDVAPGCRVMADPKLMRIALDHLVDGAWKACAAKPETVITFRHEYRDGVARCVLEDSGGGADPFGPDESRSGAYDASAAGGITRIGLAIAARIVALHGGTMNAEARPGVGVALCFTIPDSSPDDVPEERAPEVYGRA